MKRIIYIALFFLNLIGVMALAKDWTITGDVSDPQAQLVKP